MLEALCVDIGSTFTKVVEIDSQAAVHVRTRVRTRLHDHTWEAEVVEAIAGAEPQKLFLSSSAAGGLRVVAAGLTAELTTEAARMAALGAGARLVRTLAGGIAPDDVERFMADRPDLILVTGGVDGGDREVVLGSARTLADAARDVPVVLAGNRMAAADAARLLEAAGVPFRLASNVMPEFGRLDLEPARAAIRGFYLDQIVAHKGVAPIAGHSAHPLLPTPAAVLAGTTMLASLPGFGSVMVVDAGGATVDVHSQVEQVDDPSEHRVGLPVPDLTRTVEGDLGLKWNAAAILAAAGDTDLGAAEAAARLESDQGALPEGPLADRLLASAVGTAVRRHCGRPVPRLAAIGFGFAFEGKDCRRTSALVGTGGPFRVAGDPIGALEAGCGPATELVPEQPELWIDRNYALSAAGLLARDRPELGAAVLGRALERGRHRVSQGRT